MNRDDVIDIRNFRPGNFPVKTALGIVAAIAAIFVLQSTIYSVEPEEVGIIQRFGRYVGPPSDPGLHFKLPFIDSVTKVSIQRQLKEPFGFRSTDRGRAPVPEEAIMLTGDLNVAVVEWVVQFRVADPFNYLFKVRDLRETLRDMTEATMRRIVGDRTVNEVLTIGRQEIAAEVKDTLQALCVEYEMGIQIEQIVLQDVNPPDEVKASFNEVNESQQEREKLINQARADYNQAIPRARGEALQILEEAEGYRVDRVNRAKGEASRFVALYDAYRQAPEVTRRRIYLETLGEVLPRVKRKIIVDDDVRGVLPLLSLDQGGAR